MAPAQLTNDPRGGGVDCGAKIEGNHFETEGRKRARTITGEQSDLKMKGGRGKRFGPGSSAIGEP